jgi:hypothetical protein
MSFAILFSGSALRDGSRLSKASNLRKFASGSGTIRPIPLKLPVIGDAGGGSAVTLAMGENWSAAGEYKYGEIEPIASKV